MDRTHGVQSRNDIVQLEAVFTGFNLILGLEEVILMRFFISLSVRVVFPLSVMPQMPMMCFMVSDWKKCLGVQNVNKPVQSLNNQTSYHLRKTGSRTDYFKNYIIFMLIFALVR